MKKFLSMLSLLLIWFLLSSGCSFAASCLTLEFDNWDDVCIGVDKSWTNKFNMYIDRDNLWKNSILRCYITLPNWNLRSLDWCEWSFSYSSTSTQNITVASTYITKNNTFYANRLSTKFNFNNGSWWSSSSSSHNSDEITLSTNRKSPSTNQYVNLTIDTYRNYTGKLSFSAKYRSSSSSSWTSISNLTSSSYFSDYSNDWSRGYYKMTSSDRGNIVLSNLVKFRKSGYYRIYVEDVDGNESYIEFSVDTESSSYNDDLKVYASPSNPDTYEWVKLTIETDDDYTGKINFSKFQYRSSSSSSWSTISRTSSSHISDYSSDWSNWYYKMKSSDDWYVTLKNLVKFKKSGYYRIYLEDNDNNETYVQINVDTSSSRGNDDLEVSASPSSPDTNEWVKLTIETDDDYTGKINFSKLQYRSSNSASWSTISRTSSTYVSNYTTEWDDGYYKMKSSDNGKVTLKNLIKFRKSGYYRIYVEDVDGNESYVQINVDTSGSSSSSDEITLSTNRKSPSTSQYVNLTIETKSRYTGKLSFSAKYRSSSSSSWTSISNLTSSSYFYDYSNDWSRGYYKMTSSDGGEVTLKNLVTFNKKGYYRIYVEDTDGNKSYIQFSVWGAGSSSYDEESDVSGFSVNELNKVKSVYKEWDGMIWEMQRKYPSLKKDTYWIRLSENFKDKMRDVLDDKRYRDFDDYDDFDKAFNQWYEYTMRNI